MTDEIRDQWRKVIEDYARGLLPRLPSIVSEYLRAAYSAEFHAPVPCMCDNAKRDAAILLAARWREENTTVSKMETATNEETNETKSKDVRRPAPCPCKRTSQSRGVETDGNGTTKRARRR